MLWDIYCKVIDNHGDIGVCWRLSAQLADRGERVRLWVDDGSALRWMAPQGHPRVAVLPWDGGAVTALEPGDIVIEAFGCELSGPFQAAIAAKSQAARRQPAWVNLEHLTAEPFALRNHGLPSPLLSGPAAGLSKHFFYPGFTPGAGGLLRESDLLQRQSDFDRDEWLAKQGVDPRDDALRVSLFCYEPPALERLLDGYAESLHRTRLLVTAGRATAAVQAALGRRANSGTGSLSISFLPLLSQEDFDHILWACDLNFVRGEDSLARALWAGKPFVWQIYPQHDDAHHAKLTAFLDWLGAPQALREFHWAWNGIAGDLSAPLPANWRLCVEKARQRLLAQEDLVTQLMRFTTNLAAKVP